jgi:6-phosphofructokinase 1
MNQECRAQGVRCCVVGVPKSIDNDILLIDRCFGFETAVAEAKKALLAGKVEATSAYRCVHFADLASGS